jgi:glycosyltransferase involved in cell wall biosynthesis
MAVGLATLLGSPALGRQFRLRHVNLNFEGRGRWGRVAGTLRALVQAAREMLLGRPDLVYLSLTRSRLGCLKDCALLAMAAAVGARPVVTVRGGDLGVFFASCGPCLRRLVRWAYGRAARAIALGPSLAGQYAGLVPAERVRIVWNAYPGHEIGEGRPQDLQAPSPHPSPARGEGGVAPSPRPSPTGGEGETVFRPLARRPRRPAEPLRLLFLSNVLPSKGLFEALEGAALARARGVPIRFTFAGAFQDRDGALAKVPGLASENVGKAALAARFEATLDALGLRDVVRHVGTVEGRAKWDLLAASDVLVLPIWNPTEGQPLAIIEAMRAGCAVVTTAAGGVRDLVADGQTGRVVAPRSAQAVAEAIEWLWRRPADLDRIARANAARARRRHSPEAHVEGIVRVLREALRDGAARRAAKREASGALGWAAADAFKRWDKGEAA